MTDTPATNVTVHVEDLRVEYRLRRGGRHGADAVAGMAAQLRGSRVVAVDGVSFQLRAGDVVGLVGSNGSGKSTLLRTVAGLTPPTSGTALTSARPLLLSVGAALLPELSGRRNAYLGCLALGLSSGDAADAVDDVLAFADLGDAVDRPLGTYSSGMGARLKFAIATVLPREIVFIDEALAVGDAAFQRRSKERLARLADTAGTVVLVSHSPAALRESCTRGLWLEKGTLRADGPIDDVLAAYDADSQTR